MIKYIGEYMSKKHFTIPFFAIFIATYAITACSDENQNIFPSDFSETSSSSNEENSSSSTKLQDPCPDSLICDTTYVDKKAYSFIYYSGPKKIDTVTASAADMSCNIDENTFSCKLEESYRSTDPTTNERIDKDYITPPKIVIEADSLKHLKINIKRVDTTYINYGKQRLMDYIMPYIETPKLNVDELRAAMDTVTVEYHLLQYNEINSYYAGNAKYMSSYEFEEWTANGLPDWVHIDADSYTNWRGYCLDDLEYYCEDTYTTYYPSTLKELKFEIYLMVSKPISDTTVTWTAYYKDLYEARDSVEITTHFMMKQ